MRPTCAAGEQGEGEDGEMEGSETSTEEVEDDIAAVGHISVLRLCWQGCLEDMYAAAPHILLPIYVH